jgi:hypothetical protein
VALDALFTTPDAPRMAFKGGTSLSKAYGAIRRFSEDVDVTLSPVELAPGQDVFAADMTSKGAKRMGHLLRGRLRAVLAETVVPHLRRCARRVPFDVSVADATEDGIVVVQYPTLADSLSGYLSEGVRSCARSTRRAAGPRGTTGSGTPRRPRAVGPSASGERESASGSGRATLTCSNSATFDRAASI